MGLVYGRQPTVCGLWTMDYGLWMSALFHGVAARAQERDETVGSHQVARSHDDHAPGPVEAGLDLRDPTAVPFDEEHLVDLRRRLGPVHENLLEAAPVTGLPRGEERPGLVDLG